MDINTLKVNNTLFQDTFAYKLIYIFSISDKQHKGLLKIGEATIKTDSDTDQLNPSCKALNTAARERIDSYTKTAAIDYTLLYTELAIREERDDSSGKKILKAFKDHDVHDVLKHSGFERKKFGEGKGIEWFKVDLQTAINAIAAVKKNQKSISQTCFKEFYSPIIFRPEQEIAISQTIKAFKDKKTMLWNAKMRFGKTLCALEVIKQSKFKKSIIITHRPVVDEGWYEDFKKIFFDNDSYKYGSKKHGATIKELKASKNNIVYFASIQDLRGSEKVDGKYSKNDFIFDADWDFVVVDEAHEGTTTALGNKVIKELVKPKTKCLALSGTPFNILNEYDNSNIFTWDYVMEQKEKLEWDSKHFGDCNPYDDLPKLNIYAYDLGTAIGNRSYNLIEDKAFNFHEFFRTWTGNKAQDYDAMPSGVEIGDFCHPKDVMRFLNLITKEDDKSNYPYSCDKYRKLFQHTLWVVPGVSAAKALSKMLKAHNIFGNGAFNIVNVAGAGDEEERAEDALKKVRKAIDESGKNYTITISCGRLTTGVTVPEWTAVFMLAGGFSTSAANYLQTIFRVQSPCNKNGKVKECCYVFDFAPDRTLKMVAEAAAVSTKAGTTTDSDRIIMGRFLNYCPIISFTGSKMNVFDTNKLLQQLKKAYAERAIQHGFDDSNIYNDELLKLDGIALSDFNELKNIIGKTKASHKTQEVNMNKQGFTKEEHEKLREISAKPKRELTAEEKKLLEKVKEKKKQRDTAVSILRGISIRMPLLIYGADVDFDKDITMEKLVDLVDDSSWEEFMPNQVTKSLFKKFIKYYDKEIFIAAGRKIKNTVKGADLLSPTERVKQIGTLFSCFKNPDKETVLTPWRVVNMHMSDTLGGFDFYDEKHAETISEPRFVNQGKITTDTFGKKNTRILEINSKTGLYPLYVAYSIYRLKCKNNTDVDIPLKDQLKLWNSTIQDNIFVICKTPMAKQITQRTLAGYSEIKINAHYFDSLLNAMENKPQQFVNKVLKVKYWVKEGSGKMKFDAVIGNPPYQEVDNNSNKGSAKPLYHNFVKNSISLSPNYISLITPSVWFTGGKGLDDFRNQMLNESRIEKIYNYITPQDVFSNVNLRGGVNYFLWNSKYNNIDSGMTITNVTNGKRETTKNRPMCYDGIDILIADYVALNLVHRFILNGVIDNNNPKKMLYNYISVRNPFGFTTDIKKDRRFKNIKTGIKKPIKIYASKGVFGYVEKEKVLKNPEWISKWKVITAFANNIGTDLPDDNLNTIISAPNTISTETYLVVGGDLNLDKKQCINIEKYLKTKFVRYLISIVKANQNGTRQTYRYVPLQDFTTDSDIHWEKSVPNIDKQLYSKYKLSKGEIKCIEEKIKIID